MNKKQIEKLVNLANKEAARKKHTDKEPGDISCKNIRILSQEGHDFRKSHCIVHCYNVGEWAKMGRSYWQNEWFHCEENCQYKKKISNVDDDTKNSDEEN